MWVVHCSNQIVDKIVVVVVVDMKEDYYLEGHYLVNQMHQLDIVVVVVVAAVVVDLAHLVVDHNQMEEVDYTFKAT
jgi:hypothetical protein